MCLLVFSFDPEADQKLLILANRDEFVSREAKKAHFWQDYQGLLAGRDMVAGGTWLGVHSSGRMSAITNFRDPGNHRPDARSRGDLTVNFLSSNQSSLAYLRDLESEAKSYNGYNLIVYDGHELGYYSNRLDSPPILLQKGLYGISNHTLDTPWPKVVKAKEQLRLALLERPHRDGIWSDSSFLDILGDVSLAPDHELPDTGVGIELERKLSAMTIQTSGYGTRCTSMVGLFQDGGIRFAEKTLGDSAHSPALVQFHIQPDEGRGDPSQTARKG